MKKKRASRPADEQAFLAAYDASKFPHPSLATDVALLSANENGLQVVLIERPDYPDLGKWSLPGGFVGMEESLDEAAIRVLRTKVGVQGIFLEQLYTFGDPARDPRTRVIAVAYYALVNAGKLSGLRESRPGVRLAALRVPRDGERGKTQVLDEAGRTLRLAFDHAEMLALVVQRLRGKLDYAPIGFELLPKTFTLRQLQSIHETILARKLNKDSFRRRMLATGLLSPTGKLEENVDHRPAELYRFKRTSRRR